VFEPFKVVFKGHLRRCCGAFRGVFEKSIRRDFQGAFREVFEKHSKGCLRSI
jgi:hypothetical protein